MAFSQQRKKHNSPLFPPRTPTAFERLCVMSSSEGTCSHKMAIDSCRRRLPSPVARAALCPPCFAPPPPACPMSYDREQAAARLPARMEAAAETRDEVDAAGYNSCMGLIYRRRLTPSGAHAAQRRKSAPPCVPSPWGKAVMVPRERSAL